MPPMKVAVLPLNAAEGTKPALGRQIAAFLCETLRSATGAEVNAVSYLAQVEQNGQQRAAFVNVANGLLEYEFLKPLFAESGTDKAMHGTIEEADDRLKITIQFHGPSAEQPLAETVYDFSRTELFPNLHAMLKSLADQAEATLPDELDSQLVVGTDIPESFLSFLEGYDSLNYVQQANGLVAEEFSPEPAYDALVAAAKLDPDFVAPYEVLCGFARTCGMHRIGTFDMARKGLMEMAELVPDDFRAWYSLGELYYGAGDPNNAAESYETALRLHTATKDEAASEEDWKQEQASIYSRIGLAQAQMGMPVNAEQNLRKAVEMEGPDKPSLDLLSTVLAQTNRIHEVPPLWRKQVESDPQNASFRSKLAFSLIQAGQEKEGVEVFEKAITEVEDSAFAKRMYAPYLAQKGDFDRAMDLYEDCLDVAPNDVQLLQEYARTLQAGNREFEVPKVLDDILKSDPDPNTRAEVLAWKTELTEPRRAEAVKSAEEKLNGGDPEAAIRELRPMRNWLADYWKLWAVLAAAYNRAEQPEEALEAAERLLGLYPACEPGYAELAGALTALGRNDDAYNAMRYAASQIPGSLGIHLNLALAAKRAGHTDEARDLAKQIREAIGPNPDLEPVFEEIER